MSVIVLKRDGSEVDYDLERISIAIAGAFEDLNKEFEDINVLNNVEHYIRLYLAGNNTNKISVEQIQDFVEKVLMENGYIEEAKAYILYRYDELEDTRTLINVVDKKDSKVYIIEDECVRTLYILHIARSAARGHCNVFTGHIVGVAGADLHAAHINLVVLGLNRHRAGDKHCQNKY